MPVAGKPVLTQEMYDASWESNNALEKTLEDIKNGLKIPKYQSYPYSSGATLGEIMDLMCGVDKNGKWVLYNKSNGNPINETLNSKDEMLERARWHLSRGVKAGLADMAQANGVYKNLLSTDENAASMAVLPDPLPDDTIIKTQPIMPDSGSVQEAYNKGYRDSLEYTKFKDSTFVKRMDNLSAEESKFIYKCICAGVAPAFADDIVGIYCDGEDNVMTVILELVDGEMVKFDLRLDIISETENTAIPNDYNDPEFKTIIADSFKEAIENYTKFGVTYDSDTRLMMYEGHPVREILDIQGDGSTVIMITESAGVNGFGGRDISGAIDLRTVYENGVMTSFRIATQEEYDIRTEERRVFASSQD
jgi:hypothetical protein